MQSFTCLSSINVFWKTCDIVHKYLLRLGHEKGSKKTWPCENWEGKGDKREEQLDIFTWPMLIIVDPTKWPVNGPMLKFSQTFPVVIEIWHGFTRCMPWRHGRVSRLKDSYYTHISEWSVIGRTISGIWSITNHSIFHLCSQ